MLADTQYLKYFQLIQQKVAVRRDGIYGAASPHSDSFGGTGADQKLYQWHQCVSLVNCHCGSMLFWCAEHHDSSIASLAVHSVLSVELQFEISFRRSCCGAHQLLFNQNTGLISTVEIRQSPQDLSLRLCYTVILVTELIAQLQNLSLETSKFTASHLALSIFDTVVLQDLISQFLMFVANFVQ